MTGSEVGSGTRRRPIGRDYAAAKDAEVGRGNFSIVDFRFRIDRAKRREQRVWRKG